MLGVGLMMQMRRICKIGAALVRWDIEDENIIGKRVQLLAI